MKKLNNETITVDMKESLLIGFPDNVGLFMIDINHKFVPVKVFYIDGRFYISYCTMMIHFENHLTLHYGIDEGDSLEGKEVLSINSISVKGSEMTMEYSIYKY